MVNLENTASDCGRVSGQIRSLSIAATCVWGGWQPADEKERESIVYDILDVIERLSVVARDAAGELEHALLINRSAPGKR